MSEFERRRLEDEVAKLWADLHNSFLFTGEDFLELLDELEKKLRQLGVNL